MKILKRTPRTDMYYNALLDKMGTFWGELAKSEGTGLEGHMDRMMTLYARMSVRCEFNGKVDFELAQPGDTSEQVKKKFLKFLDSEQMDLVDEVAAAIGNKGFRGDPVTAPESPGKN